jgi:YspA, cpYpsA-related SLOG family
VSSGKSLKTFRALITGSRDWIEPLRTWEALNECRAKARRRGCILVVIHGDAPGADMIAKLYAQLTAGVEQEPHPANWEGPCNPRRCKPGYRRTGKNGREYCPAAGDYRNEEMIATGADRAAAFIRAGSHGASNCARLAQRGGIRRGHTPMTDSST